MRFNREAIQRFFIAVRRKVFRNSLIIAVIMAGVGGVFVMVTWWQYVFQLRFITEPQRESIKLHEKQLERAIEIIEERGTRFLAAPEKEYRDLFSPR